MQRINKDVIVFNGYRFVCDKRAGYYLSSMPISGGKRVRLHRYVWEFYYGKIPDGYAVHHIDGDIENNNIENLKLMPDTKHKSHHSRKTKRSDAWKKKWETIRQKGSDAHKRPEEREKQSQRSKELWEKRKEEEPPSTVECIVCGKEKETYYPEKTLYCSKPCKAKAFRKNFKENNGYGYDKKVRPNRGGVNDWEQSKTS